MGVTIPEATDYGTPVPRAATTVQSYNVGQPVQQDVAAWTYAAQSAKAAADSDAKAMEGVGVEIAKWSDQLQTTQAQDSLNQLRARRQELTTGDNGFMKVQGGNVVNPVKGASIYETFPTQFQGHADDIGSKLSGKAAMLYKQAMAAEITGFKSDVARHGLAEGEKYRGAVQKDTQLQIDNKIAAASDPAEIDILIKSKVDNARQYATSVGLPGDAAATAAGSDAAMLVIQKAVNTGDSGAASAALTKYGTYLDAKDRIRVDGLVKTLANQDSAVGEARDIRAGVLGVGPPPDPKDAPGVVKHFEGILYKAKVDTDGKYRVGYGSDTVTHPDGTHSPVTKDTVVTKEDAERDLARRLPQFQAGIKERIGSAAWDALTPEAKASATSIAYNYGSIPDRLVKSLQSGDPAQIAQAIRGLSGDNGRINARRRGLEAAGVGGASGQGQLTHDGLPARKNPDGSYSTEVSITVQDEKLNGGKPTNIPSLWGGKEVSREEAVDLAVKSGNIYVGFNSIAEAEAAAKAKSAAGGAAAPQNGALYKDPDVLLYQLNEQFKDMTIANQERNATNIGKRTLVQTELELWHTAQKKQIEQMRLAQKVNLNQVMTTGGPDGKGPTHEKQIPTELWAQLSFRERESVTNIIKHNAKGTEAVTDQKHWLEIQKGLTSADPVVRQKWADYDLWESKDKLDNKDLQELAKMQGVVRKGDPDKEMEQFRTTGQMVDDALKNDLRVDPSPDAAPADAARAYRYRRDVQDAITALQNAKKQKLLPEERQSIIDAATRKARQEIVQGDLVNKHATHVANFAQKITETLNTIGVDPTPSKAGNDAAKDGHKFKLQAEEYLGAFEKKYGVTSSDAEQRKLLSILTENVPAVGLLNQDTTVPLWNIKARQIPKADRASVDKAFESLGVKNPTDDMITKLYVDTQIVKRFKR